MILLAMCVYIYYIAIDVDVSANLFVVMAKRESKSVHRSRVELESLPQNLRFVYLILLSCDRHLSNKVILKLCGEIPHMLCHP